MFQSISIIRKGRRFSKGSLAIILFFNAKMLRKLLKKIISTLFVTKKNVVKQGFQWEHF
jgi:hypothetical protein